jgi:hypothetical protein
MNGRNKFDLASLNRVIEESWDESDSAELIREELMPEDNHAFALSQEAFCDLPVSECDRKRMTPSRRKEGY